MDDVTMLQRHHHIATSIHRNIDTSQHRYIATSHRHITTSRHRHMYVELHTSSAFSFLRGASLPETLVERAAALGYPALALLDRDGVYGAPRFHIAAKQAGIRAIIGAELTIAGTGRAGEAGRAGRLEDAPGRARV